MNAPVSWESVASRVIAKLARAGRVFSSDEVWTQLAKLGVDVCTEERRMLSNVIKEAQASRIIRSAGVRKSARASRKGGYLTMWRAA